MPSRSPAPTTAASRWRMAASASRWAFGGSGSSGSSSVLTAPPSRAYGQPAKLWATHRRDRRLAVEAVHDNRLGAELPQPVGLPGRAGGGDDLVPGRDQGRYEPGADRPRPSSHEHLHLFSSRLGPTYRSVGRLTYGWWPTRGRDPG